MRVIHLKLSPVLLLLLTLLLPLLVFLSIANQQYLSRSEETSHQFLTARHSSLQNASVPPLVHRNPPIHEFKYQRVLPENGTYGRIANAISPSPQPDVEKHHSTLPSNDTPVNCTQQAPLNQDYLRFCPKLLEGDFSIHKDARLMMTFHPEMLPPSNEKLVDQLQNCTMFVQEKKYSSQPSPETCDMPIAYSIVFHKDVGQVERLLRNIYQPHNYYCLHVDQKARTPVHTATRALAECFPNVFIASKLESVVYGSFSRLQADLNCMRDLAKKHLRWKYLINLTGQMFPLKTTTEIAKILKIYNGANDIEGTGRGAYMDASHRYTYKWVVKQRIGNQPPHIAQTKEKLPPPPHGIQLVKGSAFGVFTREFVEFALSDAMAQDLLEWSRDTYSPDEIFWSTLNHQWINPMIKAPGSYAVTIPDRKPWLATYSSWKGSIPQSPCHSFFVHGICIFSLKDLPHLISRKELFANKFYADHEPMIIDCLEMWLTHKSSANLPFDGWFYRELPFVRP